MVAPARIGADLNPSKSLGSVAGLWRFPVKSMRGEPLAEAHVSTEGMLGDRAYALLDSEIGIVSASSVRAFPGLLDCTAVFLAPPRAGEEAPPVLVALPDGTTVSSESASASDVLSTHFGRDVTLVRTVPDAYARKQAAFFADAGLALAAPADSFVDLAPLSVISTATLAHFSEARPQSRFDLRRFRMNIVVDALGTGLVDNEWVGRQLWIGSETRISVDLPDPRCAMTTLPQEDLPKDPDILRTVAQFNSVSVGASGPQPCAGVYCSVSQPGRVHLGDRVVLA